MSLRPDAGADDRHPQQQGLKHRIEPLRQEMSVSGRRPSSTTTRIETSLGASPASSRPYDAVDRDPQQQGLKHSHHGSGPQRGEGRRRPSSTTTRIETPRHPCARRRPRRRRRDPQQQGLKPELPHRRRGHRQRSRRPSSTTTRIETSRGRWGTPDTCTPPTTVIHNNKD